MSGAPTYTVRHDDCLNIDRHSLTTLFDFIYLDPPKDISLDSSLLPRVEQLLPYLHGMGFLLVHLEADRAAEAKRVLDGLGVPFKGDVIWTYRLRVLKQKALQHHHDTILVYSENPFYFAKRVLIGQSVVAPSGQERTGFPGQKPLDLMKRLLRHFGDYHSIQTVLDPFAGSGTTLVAGFELGKSVWGFDTSADACELAGKRLGLSVPASRQLQLEV